MSELDNLSDSDWLDISSGRELSDDDADDSSSDSDRDEIGSLPHSRRSSISLGDSSRESDVEGWEGLIDDSEDEAVTAAEIETGMYPVPQALTADGSDLIIPPPFIPDIEQPEEDQRVRDALDQSLVGTLSASRTSSGGHSSTHTSIRDLRLSFPDPLTSSRDELTRSYEDVSPSETAFSGTDIEPETTVETDVPVAVAPPSVSEQDPDAPSTTLEVLHEEMKLDGIKGGLDVFLYGSSSPIKWSFVQQLFEKAGCVSDLIPANTLESTKGHAQTLFLRNKNTPVSTIVDFINVYDRTSCAKAESYDLQNLDRPSLAIIYLPSTPLPSLSLHSAYLPVIVPTIRFARLDAEDEWDTLALPKRNTIALKDDTIFRVFDSEDIHHLPPMRAYQALEQVIESAKKPGLLKKTESFKKPVVKALAEQINSRQAVTLFALMSLIVGFAFNTGFRTSTPIPTPTSGKAVCDGSRNFWGLFGPEINRSAVVPATTIVDSSNGSGGTLPSSLKDLALAVFNPGITALSVTGQTASLSSTEAGPSNLSGRQGRKSMLSDKPNVSPDVIIAPSAPATQSPEVRRKPSLHMAPATGKMSAEPNPTSTALTTNVVTSLSAVVDQTVKAVVAIVRNDIQEILDAIDALMRTISAQTQNAMKNSKGKARAIGDHVQALGEIVQGRNERARSNAKDLMKKTEELISSASEQFAERTNMAAKKARKLKERLVTSKALQAYQKTHSEWVKRLHEKGKGRESKRRCKKGKKKERKGKEEGFSNNVWLFA